MDMCASLPNKILLASVWIIFAIIFRPCRSTTGLFCGISTSTSEGETTTGEMNLQGGHHKQLWNLYIHIPKKHECAEGVESRFGPDPLSGNERYEKLQIKRREIRTRLCKCEYRARETSLHHQPSPVASKGSVTPTHEGRRGTDEQTISKNLVAMVSTFSKFWRNSSSDTRSGSRTYPRPGGSEPIIFISGSMRSRR